MSTSASTRTNAFNAYHDALSEVCQQAKSEVRELIETYCRDGESMTAIARRLGVSRTTATVRMDRAIRTLKYLSVRHRSTT